MRNKYGAIKTEIDGIIFDSKAEAAYYKQLKQQKAEGAIKDFELQPKFPLQAAFTKNGQRFRAISYIADFKVIHNDGGISIVDVKGVETETFKLKRKLFEEKYPELSLQIVKGGKGNGGSKKKKKREPIRTGKETPEQKAARKAASRERRNLRKRV